MFRQIDDMSNLSELKKDELKVRAAQYFVENIMTAREQTPGGELTSEQFRNARTGALNDIRPGRYKVGDYVNGQEIVGFSPSGAPQVEMSSEEAAAIRRAN
jgi:predicted aspartyl protease